MKNILTTLFITGIISIILYFLLIRNNDKKTNIEDVPHIEVVSDETNNIPKLINKRQTLDKILESQNSIPKSMIKAYISLCGFSSNNHTGTLNNFLNNKKIFESKSEVQLNALSELNDECQLWNEYASELSSSEINKFKAVIKNAKNTLNYYMARDKNDPNKLFIARESLNSNENDVQSRYMALDYLLEMDNDLIKVISENLGTKDVEYIKNSRINIVQLYQCEIDPQSCSSQSLQTLNACLDWDDFCDKSTQELIASSVSPNQYTDLLNIVDIINLLISKGYFE